MMLSEKIQFVFPKILFWFQKNQRTGLPWRKKKRDPYGVWVSEIMLQQTQVSRVIPFYTRFLKKFPTVQSLAKASWEAFLPYYQGLGYYSRGRNMLKAAQTVVEEFGGQFPSEKSQLTDLPGIGEYTANAILSFAYNQPVLTFDTNHRKVWGRVLFGDKRADVLERDVLLGYDRTLPSAQVNEAFMDFANTVCLNTNPRCEACPLKSKCTYYATNGALEKKLPKTSGALAAREARALVILHRDNRVFFSEKKQFAPFVLPIGQASRSQIKEHFQKKYGLTLSVRPPFFKGFIAGQPTLLVKAQVLLGKHAFAEFEKSTYTAWLKKITSLAGSGDGQSSAASTSNARPN
jgi:A/G-specific adenine glycosylase